jgi:hypothetical protein
MIRKFPCSRTCDKDPDSGATRPARASLPHPHTLYSACDSLLCLELPNVFNKHGVLKTLTFGKRIAEEELDALGSYFVETDHWRKLIAGEVDIVYGAKGSGKSAFALYC